MRAPSFGSVVGVSIVAVLGAIACATGDGEEIVGIILASESTTDAVGGANPEEVAMPGQGDEGTPGEGNPTSGGAPTGAGGATASGGNTSEGGSGVGGAGGDSVVAAGGTPEEPEPVEPVATGHFKMLAFYKTRAFKHDSRFAGLTMLQELGAANDFEVVASDGEDDDVLGDEDIITPEGLAEFDMLFFMNTTGDIFNETQQQVVTDFLHEKRAFAGVHSATDTEHAWPWYEELIGEIYDGHVSGTPQGTVILEPTMLDHPANAGLPSPWSRNEEWYFFNNRVGQIDLPGLTVLARWEGQPISWIREWEDIRVFYTAMGHSDSSFSEPNVRQHILGGILWAVRRLDP